MRIAEAAFEDAVAEALAAGTEGAEAVKSKRQVREPSHHGAGRERRARPHALCEAARDRWRDDHFVRDNVRPAPMTKVPDEKLDDETRARVRGEAPVGAHVRRDLPAAHDCRPRLRHQAREPRARRRAGHGDPTRRRAAVPRGPGRRRTSSSGAARNPARGVPSPRPSAAARPPRARSAHARAHVHVACVPRPRSRRDAHRLSLPRRHRRARHGGRARERRTAVGDWAARGGRRARD